VKKEEKMRSKFAMLLAIAAVCVATAWAGWSSEERITNNSSSNGLFVNNGHKVVVATNGVRHLVWSGSRGGVYYKRYYPGSGWTPDYQLTTIKSSLYPSIALDPNGTDIHVVWEGEGGPKKALGLHIYYQKCVPGSSGNGGWVGTPKDITPDAGSFYFRTPAVACYPGHVAVAWFKWCKDTVGFVECVAGNWGVPQYFHDPAGSGKEMWHASIAVDPQDRQGDVFISCFQSMANPPGQANVFVIRRKGGVWQTWENVAPGVGNIYPSIEVEPSTGNPHVVCQQHTSIVDTYRDSILGWQPLDTISDPGVLSCERPSMFFSSGSAFVAWDEQSASSVCGIRYSIGQYGSWTTPDWVTSGYSDDNPSVTARSNGDVYVVWQDGRANTPLTPQIWGRLYVPGSFGGQAEPMAMSQSGIELFPNPAKAGRVTVKYSLPLAGPTTATLLDVSGRAMRTQEIPATDRNGSFSLDVSGLNAGVYVARLVAGDLSISKSLVVGR
jgi:hypothetical protein